MSYIRYYTKYKIQLLKEKIMIISDDDKKVVDQYKHMNLNLRKQLNNLNTQIDRLLEKHTNKVGLQKHPETSKKITDPRIVQLEVDNLRKRLELLQRDQENLAAKTHNNYHEMIKESETIIQQQEEERQQLIRRIKQYERKDKIADVVASKQDKNKKWEKRISSLQEQIARSQKIEKQLAKSISIQVVNETKATNHMNEIVSKHHDTIVKLQKSHKNNRRSSKDKVIASPKKNQGPSEQDWKQLKIDFLSLKQSKQNEQNTLNIENQRLRNQIKGWEKKIKQKQQRIAVIKINTQKSRLKGRNYSTIEEKRDKQDNIGHEAYRYRDRTNSVKYNTNN